MVIYVLLATLFLTTLLSYYKFNKSFCSPALVLNGGFFLATADLATMQSYWNVNLHWNTYFVIAGGCFLFLVICLLVSYVFDNFAFANVNIRIQGIPYTNRAKDINKFQLLCVIGFNLLCILLLAYKVVSIVRHCGYHVSILGAFGKYASLSKFSTKNVSLGKFTYLMILLKASGYVWGNFLVVDFYKNKKINILLLCCYLTTVLSTFITGSRGGSVFLILSLIPSIYLCREKRFFKKPLKTKTVILIGVLGFLTLFSFQFIGSVMGRTMKTEVSPWAYVSIYLGAPIQNLDVFLQKPHKDPAVWGCTTFYYQIQNYAVENNIPELIYDFDLPFVSYNNHNAGNVYTMFYTFFYDFGYKGVVFLTLIMAFITQVMYSLMIKGMKKVFSISRLFYMYFFPLIPLSFFSNKFYEGITVSLLKIIFFWIVMYIIFIQNTYKIKK